MKLELKIIHLYGERRGVHVIQHNTNDTKTDDDNAINLVLNAGTIFPDRIYLNR